MNFTSRLDRSGDQGTNADVNEYDESANTSCDTMPPAEDGVTDATSSSIEKKSISQRFTDRLRELRQTWNGRTYASIIISSLTLLLYIVLCLAGLVTHYVAAAPLGIIAALIAVIVANAYRPILKPKLVPTLLKYRIPVFILLTLIAFTCIELPYNGSLFYMGKTNALINWVIICLMLVFFYFLFQRSRVGIMAFFTLGFIWGLTNYFIIMFKSQPLIPSDILALRTATDVMSSYTFNIDDIVAFALVVLAAGCTLVSYLPPAVKSHDGKAKRVCINVAATALCVIIFFAGLSFINVEEVFGTQVSGWNAATSYRNQGSILCFLKRIQDLTPKIPDGYTDGSGTEILSEYENDLTTTDVDEDELPVVIAIMNETYSDVSVYECLSEYYEGLTYFDSISDYYYKGTAYASVVGAGTCNSEFEFLTGASMSNFGDDLYPYMLYNFDGTSSLVSYFNSLGYTTMAMHQNSATNWRRSTVYEQLGFDTFISIDDIDVWPDLNIETLRDYVTDNTGYQIILDEIEETSGPLFFFNVTMQNHGGYKTGLIPSSLSFNIPDIGQRTSEVEEFIGSVTQSDADLVWLIEQLEQLDRKVVLCVFGDHQPSFAKWLLSNDLEQNEEYMTCTIEETEILYEVPCLIWTNYDSEEVSSMWTISTDDETEETDADNADGAAITSTDEESASTSSALISTSELDSKEILENGVSFNYLALHMLEAAGLPLTSYYNFLLDSQSRVTVLNSQGYLDSEGTWHWLDEADEEGQEIARETLNELAIVQYEVLFGEGM